MIAGDIAGDIGNGRGPVDEDLVLGVTLIADGRRQTGVGQHIGPDPAGQGAEITLAEVPFLSGMGLTATGPRPGFGKLDDRTNQICAPGDLIYDAPVGAFNVTNLPETLNTLAAGGRASRCTPCMGRRTSRCSTVRRPPTGRRTGPRT